MNNKRQTGFSIVELMITLVIAAVLLGVAVPSFREVRLNTRTAGHSNELLLALSLARGESVKLNRPVTVTAVTAGDWTDGWTVTQDVDGDGNANEVLLVGDEFDGFTLTAASDGGNAVNSLTFSGLGRIASGARISFTLNRDGGAADKGRMICVAPNGQSEIRKGVVPAC